jgi:hypothetical protein
MITILSFMVISVVMYALVSDLLGDCDDHTMGR